MNSLIDNLDVQRISFTLVSLVLRKNANDYLAFLIFKKNTQDYSVFLISKF